MHKKTHVEKVKDIEKRKDKKEEESLMKPHENTKRFKHDTYENKWTGFCAFYSAGATIEATRWICNNSVDASFAIVRPPGHHSGI